MKETQIMYSRLYFDPTIEKNETEQNIEGDCKYNCGSH